MLPAARASASRLAFLTKDFAHMVLIGEMVNADLASAGAGERGCTGQAAVAKRSGDCRFDRPEYGCDYAYARRMCSPAAEITRG
jgi:hypothetical protein